MALAAAAAPLAGLPWTLALSALGTLGATALGRDDQTALARAGRRRRRVHAFAVALLDRRDRRSGRLRQVFAPQWADGVLIASISGSAPPTCASPTPGQPAAAGR